MACGGDCDRERGAAGAPPGFEGSLVRGVLPEAWRRSPEGYRGPSEGRSGLMVLTLQNVDGISARINDSKMNKLLIALALAPAAALVAPSVPRA